MADLMSVEVEPSPIPATPAQAPGKNREQGPEPEALGKPEEDVDEDSSEFSDSLNDDFDIDDIDSEDLTRLEAEEHDLSLQLLFDETTALAEALAPEFKAWGKSTKKLNALLRRRHGDFLDLQWSKTKGRVLNTRKAFHYGQTILTDRHLMKVAEPWQEDCGDDLWKEVKRICKERELGIEPLWYYGALTAACTTEVLEKAEAMRPPVAEEMMDAAVPGPGTSSPSKSPSRRPGPAAASVETPSRASAEGRDEDFFNDDWGEVDEDIDPEMAPRAKSSAAALVQCIQPASDSARQRMKMLFHMPVTEPSLGVMTILHGLDMLDVFKPLEVEEFLQVLIQNSFQCIGDGGGKGIGCWLTPSFLSHSCMPNASWGSNPDGSFQLMATGAIRAGEEITISYISEEDLTYSVAYRREILAKSKKFVCNCIRCAGNDAYKPYNCYICGQNLLYARSGEELKEFGICRRLATQSMVNTYVLGHMFFCAASGCNW